MIKAEIVKVESSPSVMMNLSLGVREANLLDCIIEKILMDAFRIPESSLLDSIIEILKDSLEEQEPNLLNDIIARISKVAYEEEELKFDLDETILLTNLARHIGASGMRKYIESTIVKNVNNEYEETVVDNDWQSECLAAFNESKESKL